MNSYWKLVYSSPNQKSEIFNANLILFTSYIVNSIVDTVIIRILDKENCTELSDIFTIDLWTQYTLI